MILHIFARESKYSSMKNKDNVCKLIKDSKVALELIEKENVFILLNPRLTYMTAGHGMPLVGNGINIFTTYDDAKDCIDRNNFEHLDSVYPIGTLEKSNHFTNIKNTLMIANALGIENVFLNDKNYFKTEWFLNAIGIKDKMQFDVLLTADESENFENTVKSSGKMTIRFNPITVYNYSNPFIISEERQSELNNAIIKPEGDNEEEGLKAISKNTLHENCFSQMLLRSKFIPMSIQKADMNALGYFNMMQTVYATAIVKQLNNHNSLYVLCHKQSHQVFVRDYPMGNDQKLFYVAYTDLFKHQGPLEYRKLTNFDELLDLIKETKVDGIVLTDGPSVNALIDKEAFAL